MVLAMRIVYHSFLRFSSSYKYEPENNCVDNKERNKIARTVLLSIDHAFMHLLSVAIIVYIYKPDVEDRKMKHSVLLIDNDNKDAKDSSDGRSMLS